jgi:hypothetical protein
LQSGGTMTFDLSSVPDVTWGSDPTASPPSDSSGRLPAVGFASPSGEISLHVGQSASIVLGAQPAQLQPVIVEWSARTTTPALSVSPPGGSFALKGAATPTTAHNGKPTCMAAPAPTRTLTLHATSPGSYLVDIDLTTTDGTALPPVVESVVVKP